MDKQYRTMTNFPCRSCTEKVVHSDLQEGNYPNYDVSPDGRRFVTVENVGSDSPTIRVVEN